MLPRQTIKIFMSTTKINACWLWKMVFKHLVINNPCYKILQYFQYQTVAQPITSNSAISYLAWSVAYCRGDCQSNAVNLRKEGVKHLSSCNPRSSVGGLSAAWNAIYLLFINITSTSSYRFLCPEKKIDGVSAIPCPPVKTKGYPDFSSGIDVLSWRH